jgi:glycosyltransferase involved in cell wall biosynthesis
MPEILMTLPRIAYLCLQATTEGQASHAHVHEIIAGLRALGYQVDLVEPGYVGGVAPSALGRLIEFARVQRALIRQLRRYDVLYVRAHPLALPTARAARRRGIPVIQECNGPYSDFTQAWPVARPIAWLLAAMARAQYRAARAVIAVTDQLAEWLRRETGEASVSVVNNGANVDLFRPDQPKPRGLPPRYAVFFGALQPWQGVRTILDAVIDPSWPEGLPVVFAGDGLLADEVREAALHTPEKVVFLGTLPYRDLPAVVANATASIAMFSAKYRTASGVSPLKVYESMAAGIPIVAANLPGLAEVVTESGCGVLVDPEAPTSLARAVAQVAADPAAAAEMGRRGREAAVRMHSWGARARQTAEVIDHVDNDRRLLVPSDAPETRHIAYLSLQAVIEGQDTWAAVGEVVSGIRKSGWTVDEYFPDYGEEPPRLAALRLKEMGRLQWRLGRRLADYEAIYVRAHPLAWPLAALAHRKGIPVVQECNGPYEDLFMAWPQTRKARPFFETIQRSQYCKASAVISVAQGLTEWLIGETQNPRVVTSGNGANVDAFTPDAPRRPGLPRLFAVFFGQFPPWQGISSLLEAVRLPAWPGELKLVFVGDGAMRPEIESTAAEMPDRVVYLGRVPYHNVAEIAAHALLSYVPMVAPEREAKFSPLKLYESMACGVPVVASDTIGISEVVTETDCGILFPPGDATAIVAATNRLFGSPALAQDMGRRGRDAVVTRYSWQARAEKRREVIEAAIDFESRQRTSLDANAPSRPVLSGETLAPLAGGQRRRDCRLASLIGEDAS